MTVTSDRLPLLFCQVEVVAVERLGRSFVRIELGGPELAELGVDGPRYDQRIKLVLPDPGTGGLTCAVGADESWFSTWSDRPPAERGHLRTYTIRDVRGSGAETRIVVDIVLHLEGDAVGPGSLWASRASCGDRVGVMAPRRGFPYGGIEFAPAPGAEVLMVADETAVPAVCAVLEQLPAAATGAVFMEVPEVGDVLDVRRPDGVSVTWLPRGDAPPGERLHAAVVAHLGTPGAVLDVSPDEVDPDLWETPSYSSSGEEVSTGRVAGHDPAPGSLSRLDGVYAWIAGEAAVVTGLRRHLVRELGMDRSQVSFMGYWRRGVAMRS